MTGVDINKNHARYYPGNLIIGDAAVMALLGVEHNMTWNGLFECLPPAYTEHVGRQLLAHIAHSTPATHIHPHVAQEDVA